MTNNTAITDLRNETLGVISGLSSRIYHVLAQMQMHALDAMTEHDARSIATEATELANLYATHSQQLNLLAALTAALEG